jgi:tRNA A-37 threonylcarbamoyl transferase component Bud32
MHILWQIKKGFDELLKNKIYHRNLTISNIFLKNDNIIIGKYGFAKERLTIRNKILGK